MLPVVKVRLCVAFVSAIAGINIANAQDNAAELEQAYKREFAFLEAQERTLKARIQETKSENGQATEKLEREISALENKFLKLQTQAEKVEQLVLESERTIDASRDNSEILEATYVQARSTLEKLTESGFNAETFDKLDDEQRVKNVFAAGVRAIDSLDDIRRQAGEFFLADGTKVKGDIVRVGNIAAYGVSETASGALAPAGGGHLKVWSEPAADTATALARGKSPELLKVFLFEPKTQEIAEHKDKTIIGTIESGGTIAWIIVILGIVALAMIVLRTVFLKSASASAETIVDQVGGLVDKDKLEDALNLCKETKNATGRVVAATLRNIDRDREHLEDIVSEAILHESAYLDRFGTFILVLAAVSPLLGLLGTVTGMISTFDVITEFGTGDPKLLSGGISVALVTTEIGLIVAIPTLLIGNLLSGWAEGIKNDMEKAALRITNIYHNARDAHA